jgi:hypothetical protein
MSARALHVVVLATLAACAADVDAVDETFARGGGERVLCGLGVDGTHIALEQLEAGMARARERDEVLNLFAHRPGVTIAVERVAAILDAAIRAELALVTFPELTHAQPAGLALGFDDAWVSEWFALRELFATRRARVTFFVSNFHELDPPQIEMLHALARDGHAIEAHGMGHRNAPDYVDRHGLAAYLAVEIDPLLGAMRAHGFSPTTFAYPYGDRTTELDAALLERFTLLRSVTYRDRSPIQSAPCPR